MLGINFIKAEQKLFLSVQWRDFFVSQILEVLMAESFPSRINRNTNRGRQNSDGEKRFKKKKKRKFGV